VMAFLYIRGQLGPLTIEEKSAPQSTFWMKFFFSFL
jgi:hypothetical protein